MKKDRLRYFKHENGGYGAIEFPANPHGTWARVAMIADEPASVGLVRVTLKFMHDVKYVLKKKVPPKWLRAIKGE